MTASAKIMVNETEYNCSNSKGNRLIDHVSDIGIYYYDNSLALEVIKLLHQDHLDELLAQFEEFDLSLGERDVISKIVGKKYDKCTVTIIDDEEKTFPYFKVISQGISYDSLSMGQGEHNLIYLYWLIANIPNNSVVLIEEIETFLSIYSQKSVMDFMAKISDEKGQSIVISTHSPYVIQKIPKGNICVLERFGARVIVSYPFRNNVPLRKLGMDINISGILLVEDEMAGIFLITILSEYDLDMLLEYQIEILGGEGEVRNRLKYKVSAKSIYKTLGIFDGDMVDKFTSKEIKKYNSPFILLPSDDGIEAEFKNIIHLKTSEFIKISGKLEEVVLPILSSIDGYEPHDWFKKLAINLCITHEQLFKEIYLLWLDDAKKKKIEDFLKEFYAILNPGKLISEN